MSFDKDRQIELLKNSGVNEWNQWRKSNPNTFVYLAGVDLEGANLYGVDFRDVELSGARLVDANLVDAQLNRATLSGAVLFRANLVAADFTDASMPHANLSGTRMDDVNLSGAELYKADLSGADLSGAEFAGANLQNTILERADIRYADNYILDSTYSRNAQFSAKATDPWSILRRKYTGPAMLWTILALVAAIVPYAVRALYWTAFNRYQISNGDDLTCTTHDCYSVYQLTLGADKELIFLLIPLTLIVYNVLRGVLTYMVGPMRDEEERSGFSPEWKCK